MKKIIILLLVVLCILAGCGPQEKNEFLPETMPEDFSFSLTWGCYGISS